MLLQKLFDWILAAPTVDTPYKWGTVRAEKRIRNQTTIRRSSQEDEQCKRKAEESLEKSLILMASEGWEKEKTNGNDVIYSRHLPDYGKTFKLVGTVNLPAHVLNGKLYNNVESSPKWNYTVKKARVIHTIDENTNIAHIVATGAPLVSSRDFVNIRMSKKQGESYILSSVSTTHQDAPEFAQYVRGEQGFCTYILTPIEGNPNKCRVEWIHNTNLKGWLPQYVIDRALSSVMLDHLAAIRTLESCSKKSKS